MRIASLSSPVSAVASGRTMRSSCGLTVSCGTAVVPPGPATTLAVRVLCARRAK